MPYVCFSNMLCDLKGSDPNRFFDPAGGFNVLLRPVSCVSRRVLPLWRQQRWEATGEGLGTSVRGNCHGKFQKCWVFVVGCLFNLCLFICLCLSVFPTCLRSLFWVISGTWERLLHVWFIHRKRNFWRVARPKWLTSSDSKHIYIIFSS